MHIRAIPSELIAVSDGLLHGSQHVLLFLKHGSDAAPGAFALPLADAAMLHAALALLLSGLRDSSSPADVN